MWTSISQEDIQNTNKHIKRYSISLDIKEMQINTTRKYYYDICTRLVKSKKTNNTKYW